MSQEPFYIKHGDREYLVMTVEMYREALLGGSGGEFLKSLGSKTVVAHDQLYLILSKMAEQYRPETMEIQGAKP